MAKIRAFVALPSSPELKSQLSILRDQLIEEKGDVKWDTPDEYHITLKFLGDVDLSKLSEMEDSLRFASSSVNPFSLVYSSVGAFPDLVHPKIIWAGAVLNESLVLLQSQIERAFERLGFPAERRSFHPHITLGRVKGPGNQNRLTARVKSSILDPITEPCREILLIKSDLRPSGSVYTTLNSFPLKA